MSIDIMDHQTPPDKLYDPKMLGYLMGLEDKNITPPEFKCTFGACVAIYDLDDDVAIIGKKLSDDILEKLLNDGYALPKGEMRGIVVKKALLKNVLDSEAEMT
jgi:hypothetical protein